MTFDAGRARAVWELDARAGERQIDALKRRLTEFDAVQKRVLGAPVAAAAAAPQNTQGITAAQARAAQSAARIATEQQKAALIAARELAAAQDRGAAAAGRAAVQAQRLATEEQRTAQQLANVSKAQTQAAASALRLEQAQQRAASVAARQAGGGTSSAGTSEAARARALNLLRDSEIRAARAAGDHRRALSLIASEMERAGQGTVRYNNLLAQQHRVQAQASSGTSSFGASLSSLTRGLGAIGFAFGAKQIVDFGVSAGRAALELERTQATVLALSGSQRRYNEVLELARSGQQKYGGSLSDNLAGLGSLVNLSNRTSVSLGQLDNVARRLAVVDPLQGIQGATVALKEFLTGSDATAIQSLVRRFELPKSALRDLTDESLSTADKLQALDRVLADQGITQEVLAARTRTTAAAYDRLGAAAENATTRAGGRLATAFKGVAEGLTTILTVEDRRAAKNRELIQGASDYDTFTAAIQRHNEAVFEGRVTSGSAEDTGGIRALTEAQFNYVQALRRTGVATDDAIAKAQELNPVFVQIGDVQRSNANLNSLNATQLDQLSNAMLRMAASGTEGAAQVTSLVNAQQDGRISLFRLYTSILQIEEGNRRVSAATREHAAFEAQRRGEINAGNSAIQETSKAIQDYSDNLQRNAVQAQIAQVQAAGLKTEQALIAETARLAAEGMLGEGDQAVLLAQKLGIARDAAQLLIFAQQQLGNADALADQRAGERSGGAVRSSKALQFQQDQGRAKARRDEQEAARIGSAQLQLDLGRAKTSGQRIAILEREKAATTDIAERLRIQAQIESERRSAARKDAGAASKGLGALDRDAIALQEDYAAQLDEVNRQLERGNLTAHQRNQLLIKQADLQDKIADETERQQQAANAAALDSVKDAQARIKEGREQTVIARQLASGKLGSDQAKLAALRQQEIVLEQQKRQLDIAREVRDAGGAAAVPGLAPAGLPGVTAPAAAAVPVAAIPQQQAVAGIPPIVINLGPFTISRDGRVSVQGPSDPNVILRLLQGGFAQNSGAGA